MARRFREDRGRALDLLGFASQLVFNTFVTVKLVDAEHDDVDLMGSAMARVPLPASA